jgi:TIR domain
MRKPVKKVFLSYDGADERAAREISASLKNAGFEVWDPAREILPASNFTASLQDALNTADAMVVLLSPDFSGSKYLQYEVEFALGTERFSGRLIPVLLRETKDYPWILDELQMIREHNPRAAGRAVARILSQAVNDPETSPAF